MIPNRLSIIGVGLLGGSIGLAVKAAGMPCRVVGYGHRASTLERALEMGAIDESASTCAEAVAGADLIVLCTPVGIFPQNLQDMAGHLKAGAIITDVGSTKRSVVDEAQRILPTTVKFVGSHPMAGSEKRGVEFARADLFQGANCIVTPSDDMDLAAQEAVEDFWRRLGMRITRLSPADHDRLVCDVSHLPHALAAALVAMQSDDALPLAGKGFLDTTRIAGGDGGLWRDIFLDNRDSLLDALDRLKAHLNTLETSLRHRSSAELQQWLDDAARRREALGRQKLRELNPD